MTEDRDEEEKGVRLTDTERKTYHLNVMVARALDILEEETDADGLKSCTVNIALCDRVIDMLDETRHLKLIDILLDVKDYYRRKLQQAGMEAKQRRMQEQAAQQRQR